MVPQESSSSNALRAFLDDDAHGFFIADSRAARSGVLDMGFDAVIRLEDGGDAALGVPGVGLFDGVLGEDQDIGPSFAPRRWPPAGRDAAADHQHIGELLRADCAALKGMR